jgi:6-phosphogluconolactonase
MTLMTASEIPADIIILDNAEEVARVAADRFIEIAGASIAGQGRFSVALAGGSTPRRTYEILATPDYRNRIDWASVHIFFGDERMVPPTDAESNYRMAYEAMISRLPVPEQNVHRIVGEGDPGEGARLYEQELKSFFSDAPWPRFDLVLLGMGDDGHTASLFPYTDALREQQAWVVANWVEKLKTFRVTLTAPAINHAAHIIFMVTGEGKAERLREVIGGARDPERLPSQMIHAVNGSLTWLVDKAAASLL